MLLKGLMAALLLSQCIAIGRFGGMRRHRNRNIVRHRNNIANRRQRLFDQQNRIQHRRPHIDRGRQARFTPSNFQNDFDFKKFDPEIHRKDWREKYGSLEKYKARRPKSTKEIHTPKQEAPPIQNGNSTAPRNNDPQKSPKPAPSNNGPP